MNNSFKKKLLLRSILQAKSIVNVGVPAHAEDVINSAGELIGNFPPKGGTPTLHSKIDLSSNNYSCLNASIGFKAAAFFAGYNPAKIPINIVIKTVIINTR